MSCGWHGARLLSPFLGQTYQLGHRAGKVTWKKIFLMILSLSLCHLRDEANAALIWAICVGIIKPNCIWAKVNERACKNPPGHGVLVPSSQAAWRRAGREAQGWWHVHVP